MVSRATVVCLGLAVAAAFAAAREEPKDRAFGGFLYAGSDGHVWVGQTRATLGMWATAGGVMEYRLSPELAKRFAPLVNRIGDLRDDRRIFSYLEFLRTPDALDKTPTILVRLHARFRRVGDLPYEGGTFEITSARLEEVELLSRDWLDAWGRLDAALEAIVAASLTAPGDAKRRRLAEAIEQGSQALDAMAKAKPGPAAADLVRRVEPEARAVTRLQDYVAARSWRGPFERFIARLGIQPRTALPAPPDSPADELPVPKPAKPQAIQELGIVAAVPDARLMAEKLVLGGILVERRLPDGPDRGLRAGDIVLNYRSVYDLVMGAFEPERALTELANRAKYWDKLELTVLRGDQIITVKVK